MLNRRARWGRWNWHPFDLIFVRPFLEAIQRIFAEEEKKGYDELSAGDQAKTKRRTCVGPRQKRGAHLSSCLASQPSLTSGRSWSKGQAPSAVVFILGQKSRYRKKEKEVSPGGGGMRVLRSGVCGGTLADRGSAFTINPPSIQTCDTRARRLSSF